AIVLEGGYVVRIGQKPQVKHQVAIGRDTKAIAETGYLHQDIRRAFLPSESPMNGFPELMDIEFGGVNDGIRQLAYGLQLLPFAPNAGNDALRGAERVRAPGLSEAADQRGLVGFEENQARWHQAPDALVESRKTL